MSINNVRIVNKGGVVANAKYHVTGGKTVTGYSIVLYKDKNDNIRADLPYASYKKGEEWKKNYHIAPDSSESAAKIQADAVEKYNSGNYTKVNNPKRPNVVGFVNMDVTDVYITVSVTEDGRIIVPTRVAEVNGEKKYYPYIKFSKEMADAIKAEFDAEIAKGGTTAAPDEDDDGAAVVE